MFLLGLGDLNEDKKENDFTLPESEYDRIISAAEAEFNTTVRDDPIVLEAVRELIRRFAQMKGKQ